MTEEQTEAPVDATQALALYQKYDALVVNDDDSFRACEAFQKAAAEGVKMVNEHFDEPIKRAHAKHRRLTALRKELVEQYERVKVGAKAKCNEYVSKIEEQFESGSMVHLLLRQSDQKDLGRYGEGLW